MEVLLVAMRNKTVMAVFMVVSLALAHKVATAKKVTMSYPGGSVILEA